MKEVTSFIERLWEGYAEHNPTYHNGIHGADVCQMAHVQLNKGGFAAMIKIDALDEFATLIAAAAHDFKHDGFNNGYHSRIKSDRFASHGADGLQEKYHFAEAWNLIEECNLLADMRKPQ